MDHLVSIDGSELEGGGQIVRISACLSSLLSVPIRIFNIRGGRSTPGLKAQHSAGLVLLSQMTPRCKLYDCKIGSQEVTFVPNSKNDGCEIDCSFKADTGTAGSITLLAQISLPKALFLKRPCVLRLHGGTDVGMAPTIDYFKSVFVPNLLKFGVNTNLEVAIDKKGYFPKGGGAVTVRVCRPLKERLHPVLNEERGAIKEIRIISSVAGSLSVNIAKKMCSAARKQIEKKLGNISYLKILEEVSREENAFGNGSSITVIAYTMKECIFGGSGIGSPKIKPEDTGLSAADDLLKTLIGWPEACVDQYVQDQILIYMALADGLSRVRVSSPLTLHARTVISVVEKMTKCKFNLYEESLNGSLYCIIECFGIGYSSN